MKILIIPFLLLPLALAGQIELKPAPKMNDIGEVRNGGTWIMTLSQSSSDSSYLLAFRNFEYQHIIDAKGFSIDKDNIDSFYYQLKQIITAADNNYTMKLPSGQELSVYVSKQKISFRLWNVSTWAYSGYISAKQLDKLFGKL
jgi:hypothetical protein